MIRISLSTLLALLAFSIGFLTACDETPGLTDPTEEKPSLHRFEVNPTSIEFEPDHGIKDTTVTIELSVGLHGEALPSSPVATFSLLDHGNEIILTEALNDFDPELRLYSGTAELTLTTTTIADYQVFVHAGLNENTITNTVQGVINIRGFVSGLPEVEFINHPDTVVIPSSGNRELLFEARVVHPDGQANIGRVYLEMIDRNGQMLGNRAFRMFDDGSNGDLAPNDSIYSKGLQIGSQNQPDEIDISIYALDRLGASSDTVRSKMHIVR